MTIKNKIWFGLFAAFISAIAYTYMFVNSMTLWSIIPSVCFAIGMLVVASGLQDVEDNIEYNQQAIYEIVFLLKDKGLIDDVLDDEEVTDDDCK